MLDARTAFCFVSMHNNNLEGVQCISRVSFFVNDMPTSASVVMYVKSQLVSFSAFLETFFVTEMAESRADIFGKWKFITYYLRLLSYAAQLVSPVTIRCRNTELLVSSGLNRLLHYPVHNPGYLFPIWGCSSVLVSSFFGQRIICWLHFFGIVSNISFTLFRQRWFVPSSSECGLV